MPHSLHSLTNNIYVTDNNNNNNNNNNNKMYQKHRLKIILSNFIKQNISYKTIQVQAT